jgi:hypothetical protein
MQLCPDVKRLSSPCCIHSTGQSNFIQAELGIKCNNENAKYVNVKRNYVPRSLSQPQKGVPTMGLYDVRSTRLTMRIRQAAGDKPRQRTCQHEHEVVRSLTLVVERHTAPPADLQPQLLVRHEVDHRLRDAVIRSADTTIESGQSICAIHVTYQRSCRHSLATDRQNKQVQTKTL